MINKNIFRLKKNGEPYSQCFCRNPELIENYAEAIADETQTWDVHHRLESCFTQKFLKEMNLYYDVEPEALIFLTRKEHCKVDSFCRRIGNIEKRHGPHSEETKRKIGKALSKKVLCVETGEVFESTRDAQRKTGVKGHISEVCNGKRKTIGGFHWRWY